MNKKIFAISIIVLLVDQISKILISSFLKLNDMVIIINNFFKIYNINNYGAAFSIFNYKLEFLVIASIIALVLIYRYMYSFKKNLKNNIAFGFIIGGLLGNLIDRIFLGYVRDFISIKIFNYNYPVFNFADTFIVIGIILLIIAVIKGEDKINENKGK